MNIKFKSVFAAILAILFIASSVQARWWIFGKKGGRPEITAVYMGGVNIDDVEGILVLNKSSLLANGKILIKGYSSKGKARIAAARISLDGGKSWKKAKISRRGSFVYEFMPLPGKIYKPRFEVIDETGAKSRLEDVPQIKVEYKNISAEKLVKKTIGELKKAYESENLAAFMKYVSPNFKGDTTALREALQSDFRNYSAIKIGLTVQNIIVKRNRITANISFNWQGRNDKTGQLLNPPFDNTVFGFVLEGSGYKLLYMKSPLIFGVSNQSDLASGTNSSAKHESSAYFETITLRSLGGEYYEGFVFDSQETVKINTSVTSSPADVWNAGTAFGFYNYVDMGLKSLNQVSECPQAGYTNNGSIFSSSNPVGHTICVKTRNAKYAKIYINSYSNETWSFTYVYQSNGSPQF